MEDNTSKKQVDKKVVVAIIIALAVCPLAFEFESVLKDKIRAILEARFLYFFAWFIIISIYFVHFVKTRYSKGKVNNAIITRILPPFLDNFLGAVTYGAIITSSLTLMKGLYIQLTFDEVYFKDFNLIDIWSLSIALFFLLWYSFTKVGEDVYSIIWIDNTKKPDNLVKH